MAATGAAQAADQRLSAGQAGSRIMAFAAENWLAMSIGEYEPGKGWIQSTDFYAPPQPQDKVTLFGMKGKLGEVTIIDDRRPNPGGTPVGWSAQIARGQTIEQPYALAILGSWPDTGPDSSEIALADPVGVRIVSEFLKKHGLKVESPFLTQAYQVDLDGDGQFETLYCAHSDARALQENQEAAIYAVALLHVGPLDHGKTITLARQLSYKPASRSIDAHEHLFGKRDFYRLIAVHDIDGLGRKEIVLYRAKDDATQIDVFTFDGHRKHKVLSAYKANYN